MHTTPVSLLNQLRGSAMPEVWRRFVYLYEPLIHRWAGQLGLQDADRADLVQEVLMTLLRALPNFQHDAQRSFRGWLHTIAVNKWKDFRRKRIPAPLSDGDGRWNALVGNDFALDFAEDDYRKFVAGRALQLIRSEFQPATWQAFWAAVVDERPAAEVAKELGITANAVYLACGRVVRRLRVELDGLFD